MTNQPFTPGWNEQTALNNADGCVSHLQELLEIWLRQTPKLMSEIRDGLAEGNIERMHLAAHTIRGSMQIIGAELAASLAESLETAGRTGQTSEGSELINQLESELREVREKITAYMDPQ